MQRYGMRPVQHPMGTHTSVCLSLSPPALDFILLSLHLHFHKNCPLHCAMETVTWLSASVSLHVQWGSGFASCLLRTLGNSWKLDRSW